MKAYLLFFEQILANYMAQLGRVRDLFSWKEVEDEPGFAAIGCSMPTYFFADALVLGIDILEDKVEVGLVPHKIPNKLTNEVLGVGTHDFEQW